MDNPHGEFIGNIIQEWVIKNGDFPALPCLMTPEGKNNDWLVVEPTPLKKNESQLLDDYSQYMENKKCSKPSTR